MRGLSITAIFVKQLQQKQSKKKSWREFVIRGHGIIIITCKRVLTLLMNILYSNITSFSRFVNKRASYPFGIISLAHAPVNVNYFSIGSINCNLNNADRGRSVIRVT